MPPTTGNLFPVAAALIVRASLLLPETGVLFTAAYRPLRVAPRNLGSAYLPCGELATCLAAGNTGGLSRSALQLNCGELVAVGPFGVIISATCWGPCEVCFTT